MIYFDNAATTYKKPKSVLRALNYCLKKCGGNPGRSSHALSERAGEIIYDTRERVAELLSIDAPERVVFTYNATHAINLAIKSFVTEKCHLICSDIEHNSVIRPLEKLKKELSIEYSTFDSNLNPEKAISPLIREDTKGIISTLASNVTGKRIDIGALYKIAKEHGLFLIVDASQAIGHTEIDLSTTPCDVLCAPGHKALFGIQGVGFAVFRDIERKETLYEGGSGYDSTNTEMPALLPEGYEAGTPATPAIAALGGGIDFIKRVGIDAIERKIELMTEALISRIGSVRDTILYPSAFGTVGFNIKNLPSSYTGGVLSSNGICARGGLHCAPSVHKKLGTLECGIVRLSLSYFNTMREIDDFYKILKSINF
ncbi:MAG: aminotransferase class V-fold PLP-dependent enzyme [Clostridia bacterium]|nr:aminotransferase class V-fold PLP-dependent enzyme [Clostridia bacterium]